MELRKTISKMIRKFPKKSLAEILNMTRRRRSRRQMRKSRRQRGGR